MLAVENYITKWYQGITDFVVIKKKYLNMESKNPEMELFVVFFSYSYNQDVSTSPPLPHLLPVYGNDRSEGDP